MFETDTQKDQCIGIEIFDTKKELFQPWQPAVRPKPVIHTLQPRALTN